MTKDARRFGVFVFILQSVIFVCGCGSDGTLHGSGESAAKEFNSFPDVLEVFYATDLDCTDSSELPTEYLIALAVRCRFHNDAWDYPMLKAVVARVDFAEALEELTRKVANAKRSEFKRWQESYGQYNGYGMYPDFWIVCQLFDDLRCDEHVIAEVLTSVTRKSDGYLAQYVWDRWEDVCLEDWEQVACHGDTLDLVQKHCARVFPALDDSQSSEDAPTR